MGSIDEEVNDRDAITAANLKSYADDQMAAHLEQYHSGQPVPPDPTPDPTGRYANLVGFASIDFKQNVRPTVWLSDPAQVLNALQTPGAAIGLLNDIVLPGSALVASGVYCDGGGKKLNSATSTILEFGEYGKPSTAVSDCALVNVVLGPTPSAGPQTGDGIRVHAGSTRIWGDRLLFDGPFGDEAFSILHHPDEAKSPMRISLTNVKWQKMAKTGPNANWGLLIGDGSYPNSELGGWETGPERRPPIEVTLYRFEFNDVFWRCPLVYHGRLHAHTGKVIRWNHLQGSDAGGPACYLAGAAEGIVENVGFDKAGSSTGAAAIQCDEMYGYLPRLTERNNTFAGNYPNGKVVRNEAPEAALALPYVL